MPAFEMASIRQFLGGACFVSFFLFYKKLPLPTTKQFFWLLILAILMFVFANGLGQLIYWIIEILNKPQSAEKSI